MSEFLQCVANAVAQRHLLGRGQKILVAVSGGVDSMVLLHALHSLAEINRWKILAAHFNHRLRGGASEADERLVRQTALQCGLEFVSGGADVKEVAAQSKISIEMAARKLRHEFLARTAREHKLATIALAHHADDQVELFFLRLLRGTGGEGLAGMKWRSPSPAEKTVSLVRPLLGFSKLELLAFATENKIHYRDDATNFDTDFLRNRIRNELLPLLRRKYQPGLDKTVLRLMDIVGAEAEFARAAADEVIGNLNKPAMEPPATGDFSRLPVAVQRKILQQQIIALGLMPDFELIEQLRLAPEKKVSVSAGMTVMRDAIGKVACHEASPGEFNLTKLEIKLSSRTGRGVFAGWQFQWRTEPMTVFKLPRKSVAGKKNVISECLDAASIGDEIILRHWQPGDRFQPIGLKSAVKLQDLFINAKIPAARRRELILATTKSGQIFWVENLRIGEPFKLTPATRRRLIWKLLPI